AWRGRWRKGRPVRFAVRVHEEGDRQLARANLHVLDAGAVAIVDLEELVVDANVQTVVVTTPAPDPAVQELRNVLAEEVDLPELRREIGEPRPVRAVRVLVRAVEARLEDEAPVRA